MPELQFKQFELSEKEGLLSFLRFAYPDDPRRSDPKFWAWQFLENPHTSAKDIPLWIAKSGKRIVGQVASIPVELQSGGVKRRALWIVDYFLLSEYRAGGSAIRLLQTSETHYPTSLTLGYNQKAAPVMSRLRWKLLGNIHRYQMLLFPGTAADEISKVAPARLLANLAFAPLRRNLSRLARLPAGAGQIREVTRFDSSFDELWKEACVQWPCAISRTSHFLDWQFMKQPGKRFDVFGYYEDERLLGYVVLFIRKGKLNTGSPKAAISDICYRPQNAQEVIDSLLAAALRLALERRVGSLVIDVLDDRIEQTLRQIGFRRIKSAPPFAVKTFENQDLLYEQKNWFLTRGDSDVSIFEDPNV